MASLEDPPGLAALLPLVTSTLNFARVFVQTTAKLTASVFLTIGNTLSYISPLPIISYLLAPFTVFVSSLIDLFVRTPYHISLYLLDAVYPIYVFCGVACITGALIGGIGRLVSGWIVWSLTQKPVGRAVSKKIDADYQEYEGKKKRTRRE